MKRDSSQEVLASGILAGNLRSNQQRDYVVSEERGEPERGLFERQKVNVLSTWGNNMCLQHSQLLFTPTYNKHINTLLFSVPLQATVYTVKDCV